MSSNNGINRASRGSTKGHSTAESSETKFPDSNSFKVGAIGSSQNPAAIQHAFSTMLNKGPQPKLIPARSTTTSEGGSSNKKSTNGANQEGSSTASDSWLQQMQKATRGDASTEAGHDESGESEHEHDEDQDDHEDHEEMEIEPTTTGSGRRGGKSARARSKARAASGRNASSSSSMTTIGVSKRRDAALTDPKKAAQYAVHRIVARSKEKGRAGSSDGTGGDHQITEDNASMVGALTGGVSNKNCTTPGGVAEEEMDPDTVKKAQNRIAQREFRQRKQEYIRALECRVELLSTDHDTQVDRLRWLLRHLLIENNQLRAVLGLLASFVGDGGMGGFLGSNNDAREELEELLLTTSEQTVTKAWHNWPGKKQSEVLRQMRVDAQLPPEGLPESADRVAAKEKQQRSQHSPAASTSSGQQAQKRAASYSEQDPPQVRGGRQGSASGMEAAKMANFARSGIEEDTLVTEMGDRILQQQRMGHISFKRPRHLDDLYQGRVGAPLGSYESNRIDSASGANNLMMTMPRAVEQQQDSTDAGTGGGTTNGQGSDPILMPAGASASAFMEMMRQMNPQSSMSNIASNPASASTPETMAAGATLPVPMMTPGLNELFSSGNFDFLPNAATPGAAPLDNMQDTNGRMGEQSGMGVMAALYGPNGPKMPEPSFVPNAPGPNFGDLPLGQQDFGLPFLRDRDTITNGFAAAYQAFERDQPTSRVGSARQSVSAGGDSGEPSPVPISSANVQQSMTTSLPCQSPAAASPLNSFQTSMRGRAGTGSSGKASPVSRSMPNLTSTPGRFEDNMNSRVVCNVRLDRLLSGDKEAPNTKPPKSSTIPCPPNCAELSATVRRIRFILRRVNNAKRRYGRSDELRNFESYRECEHTQLGPEEEKLLKKLDEEGKDYPSGPVRTEEELERIIQAHLLHGHQLDNFVSDL